MDYRRVGECIRADYQAITPAYRRDDEIEVGTENHARLWHLLEEICHSFGRPITVLEAGCGTGRYFHCLRHVQELVGIDISEAMLEAARHPVREEGISIPNIRLLRANIYLEPLPEQTFDFIYSLGMFGHGCPVTVEICNKFFDHLAPGGKLFFNTIDARGLPASFRLRRAAAGAVKKLLPGLRERFRTPDPTGVPFFGMSRRQLERVMQGTRFQRWKISSHECRSPLWRGRHLECLALK